MWVSIRVRSMSRTQNYHVPVNADLRRVEVIMLSEQDDHIEPAVGDGIGAPDNSGNDTAVCGTIFHATGRRIPKLAFRLQHLFGMATGG